MQDVVNAYWLEQFLEATYWNPDLDDHPLNALNMENENSRAFLVKEYLLPAWQELSPKQQSMVKDTFRYGLNTFSAQDWEKFTHYQLPDITRNPEDFLLTSGVASFLESPGILPIPKGMSAWTNANHHFMTTDSNMHAKAEQE